MKKYYPICVFVLIFFSGCFAIPKNTSLINEVDGAILVMQSENKKLIKALGDSQRSILDDKFELIYSNVEQKYRKKNNIPSETPLTPDQNMDVTANVIAVRDLIMKDISKKENELYEQSNSNFEKLREINEAVKDYLDSEQSLKKARSDATQKLKDITGIDFKEISDFNESLKSPMDLIDKLETK